MKSSDAAGRLKKLTQEKECPSIVLISSPDRVRRERALRFLLDNFAGQTHRPSTFSFGDQGRNSVAAFIQDISEPSLFEPIRYAVIKNINSAKAQDLEPITAVIKRAPAHVKLLIMGDGLPNSSTFKKALENHATVLEFDELKGAELRRWTEREIKQNGIEAPADEIIELVVSLAGEEPAEIARLLEKLTLYLDGAPATAESLRSLTPSRPSGNDFELADSLTLGKRISTELLLHNLLAQGSSPFMLTGLLTKTFTTLYRIRALLDRGVQSNSIRTELGVTPWLFNKYLPAAQKLPLKHLERCLTALLKADFSLKDRSLGPASIFSQLCSETSRG
jgi:DNA polymerase III delta subunit